MAPRIPLDVPFVRRALERWREASHVERRFLLTTWLAAPVAALATRGGLERTVGALRFVDPWLASRGACAVPVERAEELARWAFRAHVVPGACLPQSLAQYVAHRLEGDDVTWVVGVRRAEERAPAGLAAHAWVEATGTPREREQFSPLLSVGPA